MKLAGFATVVTGLVFLPATGHAQLTALVEDVDVLDGIFQDLAGPDDATDFSMTDHRVFKAQGRRMGAFDITDDFGLRNYERMYDEEKDEGLFASTVIAVEVDSQHDLRFSLTAVQKLADPIILAIVKIDRISNPEAPLGLATLTIDNAAIPSTMTSNDETEPTVNLRVHPSTSRLLVLREHDILVLDYNNPSAPFIESAVELPDLTSPAGNQFVELASAEIFDINGKRLAFLETVIDRTSGPSKPRPRGLTVCNLDDFAAPFFYEDPVKHLYDPLPDQVVEPDQPFQFGIQALDVVQDQTDPAKHTMYLATFRGSLSLPHVFPFHQLRQVDVSDVPQGGFVNVAGMDIDEVGDPIPFDPLVWLVADPDAGSGTDYLYAMGHAKAYAVRLDLSDYAWTRASFGFDGPRRDALFLLEHDADHPGEETRSRIWSDGSKVVDHRWLVQDVTGVFTPDDGPAIVHRGYAQGGADGAVAIFGAPWGDSLYTTSWGGVVRYAVANLAAGAVEPDYGSYQPAVNASDVFGAHSTEQIALGELGPGDYRLVVPTGRGGFYEWRIETSGSEPEKQGDPQPNLGYVESDRWPAGWNFATDTLLGLDVEFGTSAAGGGFVVIDLSNDTPGAVPISEVAVDCYDLTTSHWHPALVLSGIEPNVGDLAIDGEWLFVGASKGFAVVDLPNWTQTDWTRIDDSSVCGATFERVEGIARHGDRLFVSMTGSGGDAAVAVYAFDEATGDVADVPLDCLLETAAADDFPGIDVNGGGKCYAVQIDPGPPAQIVRVYSGTQNGHLLELRFSKNLVVHPSAESFFPIATWHNGAEFGYLSDNRVYDLDPGPGLDLRVLVSQFQETLAVVPPLGF